MTRHVVFGTGQVGHPLVEHLLTGGHDVVAVNRNGRGQLPGAQVVGGDASDPTFTGATGETWHLPVAKARTTRQIIEHVYRAGGHTPRTLAAGRTTLRALGLVKPAMREYLHTLYQFTDPWVVDDSKFRTAFDAVATPLDDALDTTLEWYRARASVPAAA